MIEDLRAPFPYFGGKSRAADLVWERFGVVVNFVEPFAGSLAVLLACPDAQRPRVETVNDANCFLANFWRATAADPEGVARAADWPVNECDMHARHRDLLRRGPALRAMLEDPHAFDVEAAGWWVWGASAWIGSGWCEEGRARPSEQLPALTGVAPDRRCIGSGVHSGAMRATGKRLPDLSGGTQWGTDEPNTRAGRGVHSAAVREPSRQLPALGTRAVGEGGGHEMGRGVHSPERRTRLYDLFAALAERLRYTRVACGDWTRILTPAVTYRHGLTAVLLDPPYPGHGAVYGSAEDITPAVRAWALENGRRPDMRICYCGYEGDAPELEAAGWEVVAWKAKGGYANQRADGSNENAKRERLWFSPACLRPGVNAGQIDMFAR